MVVTATRILISLAATAADVGDNTVASGLIQRLPRRLRWLLDDTAYQDSKVQQICQERQIQLVTPRH